MKLHIFGASGTGVTTLGQELAGELGISYFDSDRYFWEPSDPPYTVKRDPLTRNAMVRADLDKQEDWILGGSIVNWGKDVFPAFDLIVFLWLPPEIRMQRIIAREHQRYGRLIVEDPAHKANHEAFIAWAADYDRETGLAKRTIRVHEDWLALQSSPVMEIRGDLSTAERIELIRGQINIYTL